MLAALAAVFLAALLRFTLLATVPQGVFHDEATTAIEEMTISWNHAPIFFEQAGGREALFLYWQGFLVRGLGISPFSLRLASTTVGVLTIALQYRVARRLFGARIGLLSAVILATLYWHVQQSRLGLRAAMTPLVVLVTLDTLWSATRMPRFRPMLVAAAAIGLSAYTYTAARVTPLIAVGFLAYMCVSNPARWRAWLTRSLGGVPVYLLIIAPLGVYLVSHPQASDRVYQTSLLGRQHSFTGDLTAVSQNVVAYAGSFSFAGDQSFEWATNIPGRPVFDPLMGALFYGGLILLIANAFARGTDEPARRRRRAAGLCLITFVIMYLPGLLSVDAPYFLRVSGALPIVALAPAVALDKLALFFVHHRLRAIAVPILTIPLVVQTAGTTHDYFITWARSPQVSRHFSSGATALAQRLETSAPPGEVLLSSQEPGVIQALAPDRLGSIQWFEGDNMLPLPVGGTRDTYYFFDLANQQALETALARGATPIYDAADRNAGVEVARGYLLPAGTSLDPILPTGPHAGFGGRLEMTGATVTPVRDVEGAYDVVVGLRAEVDHPGDLSVSVRAVDAAGNIWGQQDGLGQGVTTWEAGRRGLAHHRVYLPAGTPPGPLVVEVRVYELTSLGSTLPRDDGRGATLVVGTIDNPTVVAPSADSRFPAHQVSDAHVGAFLHLDGYALSPATPRQGDAVGLTLLWRPLQPLPPGSRIDVEIADDRANVLGAFTTGAALPPPAPEAWQTGVTIVERRSASIGSQWPAGRLAIIAVLRDRTGRDLDRAPVATLQVQALPRLTSPPIFSLPIAARFADGIGLAGLTVAPENGHVAVTLVWAALSAPTKNYTVFVHILGPNGRVVSQHDGPPDGGAWPTTLWAPGQYVEDRHELPLASPIASGSRLEIGLYDAHTGTRLPVLGSGAVAARGRALRRYVSP